MFVFVAGSFRASLADTGRTVVSVYEHKDIVTCLSLSENEGLLATGSRDTTVCLLNTTPSFNLIDRFS